MDYLKLFRYEFRQRLYNQYSSLMQTYFPKRKLTAKSIFFVSAFLKVLWVIPVYAAILYFDFLRTINVLYLLVILLVVSGLFQGIASFKHTAILRSKLYLYAPVTMRTVYNLMHFSSLTWSIYQQAATFLLFALLSFHYLKWVNAILLMINVFLLYLFVFSFSGRLFSIYKLNKIRRPVGFVRLLFYSFGLMAFFLIGHGLVLYLHKPFQIIRNEIITVRTFQDDAYASRMLYKLMGSFIDPLKEFAAKLLSIMEWAIETSGISVLTAGVLIILIFSLQLIHIRPLMSRHETAEVGRKDIMHYLLKGLSFISERILKNDLLTYEILLLERERFLVSPKFFSMTILTLETAFYLGLFYGIFQFVEEGVAPYLVYLGFILLVLFNHSYELRYEFPQIFLLGASKEKLALYKYSGCSTKELYQTKLKLMRLLLIVPAAILICTSIVFGLSDWKYLLAIVFILFTYYFAPLVQMWAATFLIKTDYVDFLEMGSTEEEKLIDEIQAVPRKIFVVPILFILYFMLFFKWNETLLTAVFLIYMAYYLLGGFAAFVILKKMARRNLEKYDSAFVRL